MPSSPPARHLTTSVAVLTRNRLPTLKLCVDALLPQLEPGDELLILDTGSTDGTREWLSAHGHPQLRWKSLDLPHLDFGAARNLAVRKACGDLVAFLDDDCIAAPDWLAKVRSNLASFRAIGGAAVFGQHYRLPWWWSAELGWTVGMSSPALMRGDPNAYPSTSNLAAHRDEFLNHPFPETSHSFASENIYLGGREDAEWWRGARLRGTPIGCDPTCIVYHHIPEERLGWSYVWNRARTDGRAAWARNPVPDAARGSLKDAGECVVAGIGAALVGDWKEAAAQLLWAGRQQALVSAARTATRQGSDAQLPLPGLPSAVGHALRREAAAAWFNTLRALRPPLRVPERPTCLLLAAPTFMGDTLLLQPALRRLAETWPSAEISVWSTFPLLLESAALPPNIRIVGETEVAASAERGRYEVVFAPYYAFGNPSLWRRRLSRRGITFTSDVGFRRDRDYHLAARRVEKDFSRHEILNIGELLSLWPAAGELQAPRLLPREEGLGELLERFPMLGDGRPFLAFQVRPEVGWKDWPYERWASLARGAFEATGARIVFHCDPGHPEPAEELVRLTGLSADDALAAPIGLPEMIALLSRAALAVGICSGPAHVAMALQTPTFTLYGPTDPARWGALFDQPLHGFIRSPVHDLTAQEYHGLPPNYAMLKISVEEALAGLVEHYKDMRGIPGQCG